MAATSMAAARLAPGEVAVRQLDFECVVAARLAFVARAHSRRAPLTVNGDVVINDPAIRIIRIQRIAGHHRLFRTQAVAVVDEFKSPKNAPILMPPATPKLAFAPEGGVGAAYDDESQREKVGSAGLSCPRTAGSMSSPLPPVTQTLSVA